jgi:hypothetical protein
MDVVVITLPMSDHNLHPDRPMGGLEVISPRVQLRDNNVALMDAYDEIYAPKLHPGCSANLGQAPWQKFQ